MLSVPHPSLLPHGLSLWHVHLPRSRECWLINSMCPLLARIVLYQEKMGPCHTPNSPALHTLATDSLNDTQAHRLAPSPPNRIESAVHVVLQSTPGGQPAARGQQTSHWHTVCPRPLHSPACTPLLPKIPIPGSASRETPRCLTLLAS